MGSRALFGRYYPAASPVHRLDARAKLLLVLGAFAAVFAASSYLALGACALFVALFYGAARIPAGEAARAVAPLLALVLATAVLNLFFVQGGTTYLEWGPVRVSEGGVASAAFLSCRLGLLVLVASLLTLTTTTFDVTEASERLLGPLRRLGAPVHEMAMMMAIALRFLPQLADELATLRRAQASRGAPLSLNPLRGGLATARSLVVPLFASALRHAARLSTAMDARCYHGGQGRTRLHPFALHGRDAVATLAVLAMAGCVLALDFLGAGASGIV